MGMYDTFATDSKSEKEGVIIDYGTFRVTLARAGGTNFAYTKALESKTRPMRQIIRADLATEEQLRAVLMEVYAETLILDWETRVNGEWCRGIEGRNGEMLPFNKDVVLDTLKSLPDLFNALREQAESGALYRASLREVAKGNS